MGKFIDETGNNYGRWIVIEKAGRDKHRNILWRCQCDCGNSGIVLGTSLRSGASKSCGCLRRDMMTGNTHPNWKGGRYLNNYGYVLVYAPEHPNARKYSYVLEHILVMSEHLGRPLKEGETVHHRDGIKTNNHIENLELWAANHPPGQRVSDLLIWAKEIIKEYEPNWSPLEEVK